MSMDEEFMRQLFAELIDAQEAAYAVLSAALADSIGPDFAPALERALRSAQRAASHPMRDNLIATAVRVAKSRHPE
jgi:hypothetical protein